MRTVESIEDLQIRDPDILGRGTDGGGRINCSKDSSVVDDTVDNEEKAEEMVAS